MVEVKARIKGKTLKIKSESDRKITVKGRITNIYFITQENVQTIFPVISSGEVEIDFHGVSLGVLRSSEKEVIISGDIVSFNGNINNHNNGEFLVVPYAVSIKFYGEIGMSHFE